MEVRAVAKYVKVQPRKVRIIADEVKGKPAIMTAHVLRHHSSKSAMLLRKVLISAIANAAENHQLSPEVLEIKRITVDEGPRMKRIQPRAMGRAFRILKKTSHITVVVGEAEERAEVRPHGTKSKPRPTFAAAKKGKKKAEEKKAEAVAAPVEEPQVEAVEAPVEEVVSEPAVEAAAEEVVTESGAESEEKGA